MMKWGDNKSMQAYPGNRNQDADRVRRQRAILWVIALALIFTLALATVIYSHRSTKFPKADQEKSTVFEGMSSFINNGLTTEQVNNLTKAFSKYAPTAKIISVDPSSLSPGPHDPNKINPFTLNFSSKIDSMSYKGIASYSDLKGIRLILFDSTSKQVFDSGVVSSG